MATPSVRAAVTDRQHPQVNLSMRTTIPLSAKVFGRIRPDKDRNPTPYRFLESRSDDGKSVTTVLEAPCVGANLTLTRPPTRLRVVLVGGTSRC